MATVPNVIGDTLPVAKAALVAAGFIVGTVTLSNEIDTPTGLVFAQLPGPGATAAPGAAIAVFQSLGPVRPQTLKAIRIVPQVANRIMVQFEYSPLGIL